jgi:hypothetical protein
MPNELISISFYIHPKTMIESRYLEFYNYFGKFRELPVEGVFLQKISDNKQQKDKIFIFSDTIEWSIQRTR